VAVKAVPGGGCNAQGAERPYGDGVLHCNGTRWELVPDEPLITGTPTPALYQPCEDEGMISGRLTCIEGQWAITPLPAPTTTVPALDAITAESWNAWERNLRVTYSGKPSWAHSTASYRRKPIHLRHSCEGCVRQRVRPSKLR
jgi:hypothetical protein